ncbi:uncharacterized protein LY79DRAFT_287891 [Colletotrichum navitas]|uniref:Ankyrin repeat protein n=1 Tax=Colletotrichum navitas TaxID=681940 RepID=A0AAD8Q9I7_9PEZI|nr:uncharacterized protein LY79DRAFT_287891 [Colletotrichum navitas]KAK1598402.1 hypothetical protein LY79DRAFT_287891 [Colletotrichum navitas]
MEVIGAVASGIALGQLCIGISKAVRLWHSIEDLPLDLNDAVDRLEAFGPVLQDMVEKLSRCEEEYGESELELPAQHVRACVVYADKARRAVDEMVRKLQSSLQTLPQQSLQSRTRRKMRLAWAALRKGDLEKLERRLDSAVGLVLMCIGAYDRAIMLASQDRIAEKTAAKVVNEQKLLHRDFEDRIVRRVSLDVSTQLKNIEKQLQTPRPQGLHGENETEYVIVRSRTTWRGPRLPSYKPTPTGQVAAASRKDRSEWGLSLQLPDWISGAVWEIQVCWSMTGGWQQSLRSFSVRSKHSAIFAVVKKGDVKGMMAMFSKGEASPLDRDEKGSNLLYYATDYRQVEVCRTLLDLGLEDLIDDNGGSSESPLSELVKSRESLAPTPDSAHHALVSLFQSRSANIPTLTIERMLDFQTECSYSDDWLRIFQRNFLPGYHDLPLRDRAEATRLGAFTTQDVSVYRRLLNQKGVITKDDVRASAEAGFSLVHSAAAALGKRFAHEMQFNPRLGRDDDDEDASVEGDDGESEGRRVLMVRFRAWTEGWSYTFAETLRAAEWKQLNGLETVVPWDWYRVPVWTGTPLISVLGGALCRISPDLPWGKWDAVFRGVLNQWLRDLRDADVDLLQYGRAEALKIKYTAPEIKGAFDADAIAASRRHVRSSLRMRESWMQMVDDEHPRSDLYWLPVRIVGLDYGPRLRDWRLWWAPEFEAFAAEFWEGVGRPQSIMPGSWVDS